jgi:ADP-dependent NAD(P)H-hydrate dehydratase / NAD(P)H-hydrate epimerase
VSNDSALPDLARCDWPDRAVVTTAQMQAIEARVFAAGMPVAALMEKVAGRIATRVTQLYPVTQFRRVGVLVGPGHNGGDALVVARELHFQGYEVRLCCPFDRLKPLTQQHWDYAQSLGITIVEAADLNHGDWLTYCDWLLDGLFGFGLNRALTGAVADLITAVNLTGLPIVSIDLPSGIETDSGAVLGTAIRATQTLCLGLWKRGLLQENALEYIGQASLLDFDLPQADIQAVLGGSPVVQRITDEAAGASLARPHPVTTHKYKLGHLLLVCGSQRYVGAAILAGLGARASGVGMLTIAVPQSIKPLLAAQLPDAIVIGCPETPAGAIQALPADLDREKYSAIGVGCGLTTEPQPVIQQILHSDLPVVLDADGLNIVAGHPTWLQRSATTVLTPHLGEFRRLFPTIDPDDRITAVQTAAPQSGAIVVFKGARVTIADPQGNVRINPHSTPALARGGSGDVLTGLMAGLIAATGDDACAAVPIAVWWHAQAGRWAAAQRTDRGVDAHTLAQSLIPALQAKITARQKSAKNDCEDWDNLCYYE